ncbi:MAG: thioredoxin-disulfide reductase [Deltaproteobacteria bacterium]|nr:thioredoxin-disulfide reductase [Deltaproteobacteria bacterium]
MARNVTILGSGAAGLTAAIYAARADLQPLVVEGAQPGGQLTITTEVENYPGFPEGIQGPELMDLFKKQAARFGTEFVVGTVEKVDLTRRPFTITVNGTTHESQTLIVATGASAKLLGIPSEQALMGHGVSACAVCDAFFFKNQDVLVVGGGDTAIEEATFLTKFAKSVAIVHRRDALRASKAMQHRAEQNPKIRFVWDSVIDEIYDVQAKKVTGVRLKNVKTGKTSDLKCDGVFIGIGHAPNTKAFVDRLELNPVGYIVTKPPSTATSVPGVFACGDVQDHIYRQAVTAAGSGCQAALDAERFLAGHG